MLPMTSLLFLQPALAVEMVPTQTPAGVLAIPAGAVAEEEVWTPERGVGRFSHPSLNVSVTWRPSNPDAGSEAELMRQAEGSRQALADVPLSAPVSRVVAGQPAVLMTTTPEASMAILSWYCPVTQRGVSVIFEGAPPAVEAALSAAEAMTTCPTEPLAPAVTAVMPVMPDGWAVTEQASTHTVLQRADGSAIVNLMMAGSYRPSLHGTCQDFSGVLTGSIFGDGTRISNLAVVPAEHAGCRFQGEVRWEASGAENAFDLTIRPCPVTDRLPQPPEDVGLGVMLLYTPDQQLADLPDFQAEARCAPGS